MCVYKLEQMKSSFIRSLAASQRETAPYEHRLLSGVFCEESIDKVLTLPISAPRMDYDVGRREANNEKRGYIDVERRERFPVCNLIAESMQSAEVVRTIEETFNINLGGTLLRIEYTQDREGFWLEPHTDIGVKKFTMLLYLSRDEDAVHWGTTIYSDAKTCWGTAPYHSNHALVFIPGEDTWHGYEKRPMAGIRKNLIINYVSDEWRARHELAFPGTPIVSQAA